VGGKRRGEEEPAPNPAGGAEIRSERQPGPDDIRVAYTEVCRSLNVIDDFRARLLALLPLSSGAGIFLLLATTSDDRNQDGQDYLGWSGVLGGLISLGLFVFEVREIRICRHLVKVGAELEKYMGFGRHGTGDAQFDDAQFLGRPLPSSASGGREKRRHQILPSVPMASAIVYLTVIAGWGYLASVGF
jgi:hypothetical protein